MNGGDRFLFAGAVAVPSLGAGTTAYSYGHELLAVLVGLPGVAFMAICLLVGAGVILQLATRPFRAIREVAGQGKGQP